MKSLLLIMLISLAAPCSCQTATGNAETKGLCSPAVSGNKNTFTINCGISEKQGNQILAILNKLLANQQQLNLDLVLTKLDEIAKAQENQGSNITSGSSSPIVRRNGNIITYNNVEPATATAEQKKDIRMALADFVQTGGRIRARSYTGHFSELYGDANKWSSQTEGWLRSHLDGSFAVQFADEDIPRYTSSDMLYRDDGPESFGGTPPHPSREQRLYQIQFYNALDARIKVLSKFIDEFK